MHVLKTGGTDLFTRLGGDPTITLPHAYQFRENEIYPNATDGDVFTVAPQLSVDQLLERWSVRRDEIRIIMGHFPLCTVELLDANFTTLTVLREPVERTLSFLRHHRKLTPEDRGKSFEQIYSDEFRFKSLVHNHMVKMFALTADTMDGGGMLTHFDCTSADLDRAKERLETVDVVGLQEDFAGFCGELTRRFAWQLGEPLYANRTQPEDFDEALIRRIREDNALDIELYEYAVGLCAARLEARQATELSTHER